MTAITATRSAATHAKKNAVAPPTPKQLSALADTLKVVGTSTRLRLLHLLASDAKDVSELCGHLGLQQSTVSPALATLRLIGIVEFTRREKHHDYAMTPKGRALYAALASFLATEEGAR